MQEHLQEPDNQEPEKTNIPPQPPYVPTDDVLLHQYDVIVNLYKHHLDAVLKLNIFVYAVTGGILSYYLAHSNEDLIRYALLFPAIMNLMFGAFLLIASTRIAPLQNDVIAIITRFRLLSFPDLNFLKYGLLISGILLCLSSIAFSLITTQ